MKARPILMSAPMVRASMPIGNLPGRKTQTRRIVKPQPTPLSEKTWDWRASKYQGFNWTMPHDFSDFLLSFCPHGKPGDLLWVREAFALENDGEYYGENMPKDGRPMKHVDGIHDISNPYHLIPRYRATEPEPHIVTEKQFDDGDDRTRWKPSIHMPRWASRLTLEITAVRVERLQDISEEDAEAEGILDGGCLSCGRSSYVEPCSCSLPSPSFRDGYAHLWHSLNGSDSWSANPWVRALTFKVHQLNVDEMLKGRGQC